MTFSSLKKIKKFPLFLFSTISKRARNSFSFLKENGVKNITKKILTAIKKNKLSFLLYVIIYLLICVIVFVNYLPKMFYIQNFEQILFHATQSFEGVDPELIYKMISRLIRYGSLYFIVLLLLIKFVKKKTFLKKLKLKIILLSVIIVLFAYAIAHTFTQFKIMEYIKNKDKSIPFSTYYEENYVFPTKENIKFKKKNNLIIIHLESIENTYFKKSGIFDENLMPNLENIKNKEISFSGFKQVDGTGWTIGGIFSAYCGIPLKTIIDGNAYRNVKYFFHNIHCLPEALRDNGYRTYYMQGGKIKFAGKDKFFSQHGMDEIYGFEQFKELPEYNEKEFDGDWGVNDHTLFRYAKEKLEKIAEQKSPFLFSMLTVDTHHETGFLNQICQKQFDIDLKDTLSCTDELLYDFINWIKLQDFYKDTTIVIIGDHLSMQNVLYEDIIKNEDREIVNIFINPVKKIDKTERIYSTFDLFPTIIESIGAEIEGRRLGLGTSLFSSEPTLVEKEGLEKFNQNLGTKSKLYESFR